MALEKDTTAKNAQDSAKESGDGNARSGISAADKPRATSKGGGDFSDEAPGLVPPSRLNRGDRGAIDDAPAAGGELNFDDADMAYSRGNTSRMGGTASAKGGDSAPLGPPAEIQSSSNLPSDPPANRGADGSGHRGD